MHLPSDVSSCSHLHEQDAAVGVWQAVRSAVQYEPSSAREVVHDDVLSRNGLTCSEGIDPRLSRALHRADGYFVAHVLAVDALL